MPSKYRIGDHQQPHFISFATVQWVDALSRYYYKDIVIDSLKYLSRAQGFKALCLCHHEQSCASGGIGKERIKPVRYSQGLQEVYQQKVTQSNRRKLP